MQRLSTLLMPRRSTRTSTVSRKAALSTSSLMLLARPRLNTAMARTLSTCRSERFIVPQTLVKSQFITARAAARQMVKQRSGVILFVTGSPARGHVEGATAIGAAFGAIESLSENLAFELSPTGVRGVTLRTTANTDSRVIQQTMDVLARQLNVTKDQMIARMASLNFLKTPAKTSDTAKAAVFLVSDRARMMTGTVVNSTADAAAD